LRQIEDSQQTIFDQDFLHEFRSREDDVDHEYAVDHEYPDIPMNADEGDYSNEINIEETTENFVRQMNETIGWITTNPGLPMGRIVDNRFIPDETQDEQAG